MATKRLRPTGGVIMPTEKLTKVMTPKWTGSTPTWAAIGCRSGDNTMMAEALSRKKPAMIITTLNSAMTWIGSSVSDKT